MSLSGYSNNGLNQSLSGVVTITDGISTLENGKLNCNTVSVDTMSVSGAFSCGGITTSSINNTGITITNGLTSSSTITGGVMYATNITNSGNISTGSLNSSGVIITNGLTSSSTITGGNMYATNITNSGNISTGSLNSSGVIITNGLTSSSTITGGNMYATNITNSGNISTDSLNSTSTQDYDINTPTLGSIISNGGINIAKNLYSQNLLTNNNNNINGLISKTYRGGDVYIGTLVVDYLTYNLTGSVSGGRIYSMSCSSGFGGVINIMTPLFLRITSSVGRSGLTTTYYTFNVSVTNINLVIYKNSSYYSTIAMSETVANTTTFDIIYDGTTTGLQSFDVYAYMTPVYTQFTLIPDTLNTTDNYDFYVTADIEYTSNVTVPYTSGSNSFYLWANTSFSGISFFRTGCNLSVTPGIGGNTVPAELYTSTVCPLSFGTSNTNILNCNNIKITGIISKETVISHNTSIYQSYLTVRDCGVYMINGGSIFPIYFSTPDYTNFFNNVPSTGTSVGTANGVGGSGGFGYFRDYGNNDVDDRYFIHPNYGIIVFINANYGGAQVLNYENNTTTTSFIGSGGDPDRGSSCKIYYKGVEITSY